MQALFYQNIKNAELFDHAKNNDLVEIICTGCGIVASRLKRDILGSFRRRKEPSLFCTSKCGASKSSKREFGGVVACSHCDRSIFKRPCVLKKNKNNFCSSSCAALYNNAHKTTGTRRSKLEAYFEKRLKEEFPDIPVLCNSKIAIESELDFYFPTLRFALELNGIFHYEPIYSESQFIRIVNNDKQKVIRCYEQGIELMIIDSSKQIRFTEKTSEEYFQQLYCVLNQIKQRAN